MTGKQETPKHESLKRNPSLYDLNSNDNPGNIITQVQLRGGIYEEWARAMHTSLRARRKWTFIKGPIKQAKGDAVYVDFMDLEYDLAKPAFYRILCGECKRFVAGHQGAIFYNKQCSDSTTEIQTCRLQTTGRVHGSLLWKIEDFGGRAGVLRADLIMYTWKL